jgi:hypothetical protein
MLLIWMNDPPQISFKTDTKTIIALLFKGFRATSPLRFALTRQKLRLFPRIAWRAQQKRVVEVWTV